MESRIRKKVLGEVVRFGNGKSIKPGGEGRYPAYGSNGIIGGSDEYRHENGVIIGRVGAYCGAVVYCPKRFWASDNTLVAYPADDQIDTKFLYYLLLDCNLGTYAGGAAQPLVTQTVLKQVEVLVPDLPTQRKIAGILSAYDDLIENNLRRIRILEEMAQSLYREWFVHFRFPGHESTPMVDSPLGPIPEGWEVKALKDSLVFINEGETAGPHLDNVPYLPIDCLPRQSLAVLEHRPSEEAQSSLIRFKKHDILFGAMRCYFHKVVIAPFDGTTRKTCFVFRPETPSCYSWALLTLFQENTIAYASNHSRGATIPYAVWEGSLAEMKTVKPPPVLFTQFNKLVWPMLERIAQTFDRNDNLRQTRDLLLPKLLSGQMTLDVAESDAAETVERPAPTRSASRASSPVAITTTPPKPAPPKPAWAAAPKTGSPPPIDEIDRTEVLCAIRKLFNDGGWRDRETTLKELSAALGYGRLGSHIREVLSTDLLTAFRRGILTSEAGEYALAFRSITELPRDLLKDRFLTAIGRPWITRDDAIRAFARSLGYARTGEQIDHTARSLINGLLREGRLESDGGEFIRRA